MTSQVGARLVFENAKNFAASQGFTVDHAIATQGFVRSEMALSTTTANYHVPVLVNDTVNGAAFATENRLQLQDLFVVSEIGIFVAKPSSATAVAFALNTYPNAQTFTTSYATLLALYNGSLNMTVNNQQVLPSWDIWRHYKVNQTQNGVIITAQTIAPIDQNDGANDGFYPCEPNLILNGAANIQANITLPGAVTTIDTYSRIVVMWRGIKLQNVTSVR